MGSKYYYFAASLPLLQFGLKPPISYHKFLSDCERLLPPQDFKLVKEARITSDIEQSYLNATFDVWAQFQQRCCSETARFRCHQFNKNPMEYVRGDGFWPDPFIAKHVAEAAKSPDPLSAEKFMDNMRWKKLDEMVQGHHFDIDFLIVYGLKLQILERHHTIESSRGKEAFERYKAFDESREVLKQALSY